MELIQRFDEKTGYTVIDGKKGCHEYQILIKNGDYSVYVRNASTRAYNRGGYSIGKSFDSLSAIAKHYKALSNIDKLIEINA